MKNIEENGSYKMKIKTLNDNWKYYRDERKIKEVIYEVEKFSSRYNY